jgi:hypothetical protein
MMRSPSFTHHALGFVRSRDSRSSVRAPQAIMLYGNLSLTGNSRAEKAARLYNGQIGLP